MTLPATSKTGEHREVLATVLQLSDAGTPPLAIAAALRVPTSRVYSCLSKHRPNRPRAPRTRTAELPGKIAYLAGQGVKRRRIAFLLGCSRAYVYRTLKEQSAATAAITATDGE